MKKPVELRTMFTTLRGSMLAGVVSLCASACASSAVAPLTPLANSAPRLIAAETAPAAASFRLLHVFSRTGAKGSAPTAAMIAWNGTLWGTAGIVYAINPSTGAVRTVTPRLLTRASLLALGGRLYTTTASAVVAIDPASGRVQLVHHFGLKNGPASDAGLVSLGGKLYGVSTYGGPRDRSIGYGNGFVFSVDPISGEAIILHRFNGVDGTFPTSLMVSKGALFGTTEFGGTTGGCNIPPGGCGTVFKVDPNTSATTVVYSFRGGADGAAPAGRLLDWRGALYGIADAGGNVGCPGETPTPAGCGVLFRVDPNSGREKALYAFGDRVDGYLPYLSLIAVKGLLYGATPTGGSMRDCRDGCGRIFAYDSASGKVSTVYAFGADSHRGEYPEAGLVEFRNTLYGSARAGGTTMCADANPGCGTLFSLKLATNVSTTQSR